MRLSQPFLNFLSGGGDSLKCLRCGAELVELYLLGIDPDGFVCPVCHGYFYEDEEGNLRAGGEAITVVKGMRC